MFHFKFPRPSRPPASNNLYLDTEVHFFLVVAVWVMAVVVVALAITLSL